MLREKIQSETVTSMKAKDKDRTAALRLIGAKIKDRDIEERGLKAKAEGRAVDYDQDHNPIPASAYTPPESDDSMITEVLLKMAKQRRESIEMYEDGGRQELADKEKAELAVIEEFLPRQLNEAEVDRAVKEAIAETGADSIRDMGRVMGALKSKYTGQMDFGAVGPQIKSRLCAG